MQSAITDDRSARILNRGTGRFHTSQASIIGEAAVLRKFIFCGLAVVALVGLASRAGATCIVGYVGPSKGNDNIANLLCNSIGIAPAEQSEVGGYQQQGRFVQAGDYIDKIWYYFLDEGQYRYLDRSQYKLLGGNSYILGHPCYPKLYERVSEEAVGFQRGLSIVWFDLLGGYETWQAGDYIDKWRYYYLDSGRYYLLDERQYKLLGGMAYLFESPGSRDLYTDGFYCLPRVLERDVQSVNIVAIPEPSTAGFLGLGALGSLVLGNVTSKGRGKRA